jgi:hypothetical protein
VYERLRVLRLVAARVVQLLSDLSPWSAEMSSALVLLVIAIYRWQGSLPPPCAPKNLVGF